MSTTTLQILLVDDNEDDALLAMEAFADIANARVEHVARDGDEALAYLRRMGNGEFSNTSRLLLLDIRMPRVDGFEVLRQIKADPELRHLPVIMMSTSRREEDVARSYASGACSYISKPHRFDEFVAIAEQFCRYWSQVPTIPHRQWG